MQALLDAVIGFLKGDNIHLDKHNLLITTSGQQGFELAGRLFINPGDSVLVDRPTFAGALTAFRMESPRFMGVDIAPDGTDTQTWILMPILSAAGHITGTSWQKR